MFEKVLKRLCPCYFSQSDENDESGSPRVPCKTSGVKQIPSSKSLVIRTSEKSCSNGTTLNSETASSSSNVQENWKGTLNLVQPQPVYAFPVDLKKPVKRNQKNLLKPPLYWKKTMKNLHSEGPPVFQESLQKYYENSQRKGEKKKNSRSTCLKHCETVADVSSATSTGTTEVRWLKSQSLDDLTTVESCTDDRPDAKRKGFLPRKQSCIETRVNDKVRGGGDENYWRDWNCLRCQAVADISHGVVLFTAAYFTKKKVCLINIDRLENLSKKGREGNSYYTVIKLAILPSEKYIKCTKVLNNCTNPEVKQDFSFNVKELTGKVLRLSVFDASLQKQHEAVGHALLALEDIVCDQPKKYRIKLFRRTQPHICPGNLALSLKYLMKEDKFTIAVDKGRNLSLQRDKNVKLNTYVKVSLYSYGEKVKTKKSIVVMDSRDPNYNSTFTFQIRKDQIDHLSVAITVRLKGFVNDVTIGRLNFGPFFFVENEKLTPWGWVFLKRELVSHWFRMYL